MLGTSQEAACQVWSCMCAWVYVCVWGCVCAPLASSPPGHHMQSWEPRPPPSVGLMPSLSPKQLAPTSLIILAGLMQEKHTNIAHTHTHTLDGAMVYHTMTKSAELGKVFLKFILACLSWCEMNVAYMNSLFSMVRRAIGQDTHQQL